MMLGMYAEDPLAKQQSQHAQAAHVQAKAMLGADSAIADILDGDMNWFTDGGLLRMEEFGHDIDWVHEELDQSLHLQCAHGDSEDLFAREFSPYAPPATVIASEPTSHHHPTASGKCFHLLASSMLTYPADGISMAGGLRACDATEKLLMSFDTMTYTSPSPVSSPRHREHDDLLDDDTMDDDMDDDLEDDDDHDSSMDATSSSLLHAQPVVSDLESHIHGLMLMPPTKSLSTTSPSKPSDKVIANGAPDGKFKKLFEPIVHQRTIGAYTPTARKLRLEKFHEKRKKRIWKKSIKYDCRKKLADDRPRIKGRFVRVLENLGLKPDDGDAAKLLLLEDGEIDPASLGMPTATSTTAPMTPPALSNSLVPAAPTAVPGTSVVVPAAIVIGQTSSELTPPQGNSPLAAATLSPAVSHHSIHFGSFGTFPSPVVMVKLEPPPPPTTAFPLVGRAIMG
ncbi:hypothetical protein DYB25_006148 [Aphanomyces astaci]|uniref:CCT domain-containing protein n=1 Tax=Aphanomyces astaci TaxID=112090 RepID=A0A397BJX8_APHAT|nr:hypothetical protein DYB36_003390 [Aphanomyces astaci]RHY21247.1 hypothetical protein DYB25_006148 [Aphanomyces astaci]RHY55643.1 hypothetical protein DYB34_006677 [Aphanomyces astaci]RHY79051.1 hypothetical protein DYB38_005151 [Aphanomyces astaci]RHY89521.1 hypothetical protein DYB31_009850 [Aphanomyces astaci]